MQRNRLLVDTSLYYSQGPEDTNDAVSSYARRVPSFCLTSIPERVPFYEEADPFPDQDTQ